MSRQENSKQIAKNTIALYVRTLVTFAVGLITSRVVLKVLGVDDYGINNVVGGVVAMFSIVTSALSQAISRYLTFELGRGNKERLKVIFSTGVNIQLLMSLIIIVLTETLGIWFLNNKMNIEPSRMYAANWVFQFAVLAFVVNLISVPFNAAIIAHEKMKAFAYVSVLEAVLKLATAFMLYISPLDKLITYAFLLFIVSVIIRLVYGSYSKKHFEECRYSFVFDGKLFREMSKFAGWNFISSTAYIFNTQGINIASNIFFGVGVNAARGVATQVDSMTRNFVSNFTTAVKPQIIKSYSSEDKDYLFKLTCNGTRFSYFLMLVFAMPFMLEAETLLKLWLGTYPDYAPVFIKLTMGISLIGLLGDLLYTNILAIGKLKKYMICEVALTIFIFIASYILFSLGYPPTIPYVIFIIVYGLLVILRLVFLKRLEDFPVNQYLRSVIWPVLKVSVAASLVPLCLRIAFGNNMAASVTIIFASFLSVILAVYFIGLERNEKALVKGKMIQFIKKLNKHE